jgi:hypothetical protein
VIIDGSEFDDGLFRLITPADTSPEIIEALEDAVWEVDGMGGRLAWTADLFGKDRTIRHEEVR